MGARLEDKGRTRYDEELHRQNNEHVVNVETRMAIVEREEAVGGGLRS